MLANINVDEARAILERGDRAGLMSLISELPAAQKAQIYLVVQLMSTKDFMAICGLALKGLEYMQAGDNIGLLEFLKSIKVPDPIIKVIESKLTADAIKN